MVWLSWGKQDIFGYKKTVSEWSSSAGPYVDYIKLKKYQIHPYVENIYCPLSKICIDKNKQLVVCLLSYSLLSSISLSAII